MEEKIMAFTTVQGTVTRVFYSGKGAEVTESFTVRDKEIKKRWAAWFEEPHGLSEGDVVKVSGLHSDEVDEWTDKEQQTRHSVKRSLNKARLEGDRQAAVPAEVALVQDTWAAGGTYDSEAPF